MYHRRESKHDISISGNFYLRPGIPHAQDLLLSLSVSLPLLPPCPFSLPPGVVLVNVEHSLRVDREVPGPASRQGVEDNSERIGRAWIVREGRGREYVGEGEERRGRKGKRKREEREIGREG
jgi:hypothetical protein